MKEVVVDKQQMDCIREMHSLEKDHQYIRSTTQRTHKSIDRHISIQRKVWNGQKNSYNKLEKISNLAEKQVLGINPEILRNTSFPIKSSYRLKPIINKDSKYNDTSLKESEEYTPDVHKYHSARYNYRYKKVIVEKKIPFVSSSMEKSDYFDIINKHYQRRRVDMKRICSLAKPRDLPNLENMKQRRKKNQNLNDQKLTLSYELSSRKKERIILLSSTKAGKS